MSTFHVLGFLTQLQGIFFEEELFVAASVLKLQKVILLNVFQWRRIYNPIKPHRKSFLVKQLIDRLQIGFLELWSWFRPCFRICLRYPFSSTSFGLLRLCNTAWNYNTQFAPSSKAPIKIVWTKAISKWILLTI